MTKINSLVIIFLLCPLFTLYASASDGPSRSARKCFKKGQTAYEKADYAKAREDLNNAIKEFPAYAQALYTLGKVDLKEKKVQQAVAHMKKAVAIDPGLGDAQLALGRIYMAVRQPGEALLHVEEALKKNPDRMDALLIKGSALIAQKRYTDVIGLLAPRYNKGEHDPNLILLLAGAYLRQGDSANGTKILNAGIADNPKATVLYIQLANAYLREGNLAKAQQLMEKVVAMDPANINHAISLARLYQQSDASQKVDPLLTSVLGRDTKNSAHRVAIANFYLESKNVNRAREILIQGINDGDPGAHLRLALGELYIKTGKSQEAVDLLKKGLATTPADNVEEQNNLRNALAKTYLAAGDVKNAKTYADAVLENAPQDPQALLSRGMAFKAAGQPQEAVADFEHLLQVKPDLIDGYLQLADAHLKNGQPPKAKSTLNTGLRLAPYNQKLLMAAYRVCLKSKDYKGAEEYLQTVVEKYPHAIDAQAELGDFYLALNDDSSARREYSEIVLKSPRSPIGHIKLARLYTRQGKIDNAIKQLQKGYVPTKQSREIALELTSTLIAADRHAEALELCEARLMENPKEALAYDLKGKILTSQKKYKDAQKAFEKACELAPTWPQAGNNLAALFLLQDKKKQAINRFETTLEKNPKNPVGCLTLGKLYEEQKQYDKAISVYEKGVGHIPGFWSGANRLAFLLADRATKVEDLDRAAKLASAAYRLKPGQGTVIDTLAWIQYKKGDPQKALALYDKLIVAAPEDPIINYHMGMVLKKTGDTKQAKEKLKIATRDDKPFYGREHAEAMLKEL